MRLFLALALSICFLGTTAHAQSLFVKPKSQTQEQYQSPQDAPQPPATAQPRSKSYSTAPKGNNAVTGEMASKYYQHCSAQQHPKMTPESLNKLCACTARAMQSKMSVEEIKGMAENTPQGQYLRNKMLINIYAPCMQYPTYDLLMGSCLNDPKVQMTMKNYKKTCHCMADAMGRHMAKHGPKIVANSLLSDPNNMDPLGAYLDSTEYNNTSAAYLQKCIQAHETGGR